jgi:hypothetical protein
MLLSFSARYAGRCIRCGEDINSGESVKWSDTHRTKLIHTDCKSQDKELPSPEAQDELERAFLRGEFYPDPVSQ